LMRPARGTTGHKLPLPIRDWTGNDCFQYIQDIRRRIGTAS
jgi:hypothetical protein